MRSSHARNYARVDSRPQGVSMQMRIKRTDTLRSVKSGESRYDEEYAEHARRELRKFVEERTQTEAARLLRVSQATISRNLVPTRQPSFRILIRLAQVTHRTIDDLIGLGRVEPRQVRLPDSEVMRVAQRVAEHLASKMPSEPPPAPERDGHRKGKRPHK